MSASAQRLAPGAYKFTVKSTEEAVALIREKLGPSARVLSVRAVEPTGLKKFFSAPRLEVIAQVDAPALRAVSAEAASPADSQVEGAAPSAPSFVNGGDGAPPSSRNRLTRFPSALGLTGLLRRSGITETALNRLQSGANWNELNSLPLHRAVLDAVIARNPAKAEKAVLMLIDGAREDIELVLASRRKLPRLNEPARQLKAA